MRLLASQLRSPVRFLRAVICVSFLIFILSGIHLAQSQADPPGVFLPPITVEINKPVEGQIGAGKKQVFELTMAEGDFASFKITSPSVKMGVTQVNPDGAMVELYAGLAFSTHPEFKFVAWKPGKYGIEIFTGPKSPDGPYSFVMKELRPATEDDKNYQRGMDFYMHGEALFHEGRYEDAISVYLKALDINTKLLGPEDFHVAKVLDSISSAYLSLGDYVRAIDIQIRAVKIKEKLWGRNDPRIAQDYYELGMMNIDKGDIATAEQYFSISLDILTQLDQVNSIVGYLDYSKLGEVAYSKGDLLKANELLQHSLTISEKMLGPDHYHLADILLEIGRVAFDSGDLASSEAAVKRALANTEKRFGDHHWRDVLPLNDLGRIYLKNGDIAKAQEVFERAFAINEEDPESRGGRMNETLSGLARIYSEQASMTKALTFQTRVSENEETLIGMNLVGGSEREKLAFLTTLSPLISANVSMHINLAPNDPAFRELALTTILRRKGRVQDFIAYGNQAAMERLSPDDRKLIVEFNDVTAKLSSIVLGGPEGETADQYQKKIKDLEAKREQLETEINNRNITYFRRSPRVMLSDVRMAIPDDAALIEFAINSPYDPKTYDQGEPHYAVYVLRKTGEIGWKDLGDVKSIDAAVSAMAGALRDPRRNDVEKLARALDEKIMRPVRGLVGTATHLLVSPDGELNIVPFNALVDENGKYLVERYSFTYLSSGRDLLRMQDQKKGSAGPPIVVGNPAYGSPSGDEAVERGGRKARTRSITREITDTYFAPLSGTEQEARSISAMFPDSKYLTGAAATETSLKQARSPRILHIATHGFFLEDKVNPFAGKGRGSILPANVENPLLRSGLALAGANLRGKGDDDGLLTALEASGLDLWGTQMVVLSACDTGLGEISNGEGVYGLRRAFGIAGAESIVMSLWPVSDQVTRDLMISYYKDLKQGAGRGEALRRVQLEMLKKPGRNHPFYWASFIQAGDWRSIR